MFKMEKVMSFIEKLLTSGPNSYSSQRFMFLFTGIMANLFIFPSWAIMSIKEGKMHDVPNGTILLYCCACGITAMSKVWQSYSESKREKPCDPQVMQATQEQKVNEEPKVEDK